MEDWQKTLGSVGFYSCWHPRAELWGFYFSTIPREYSRSCGKQGTGHGHMEVLFPDGKEMKFYGVDAGVYPGSFWGSVFQSAGEAEAGNSSLGRSQRCSCGLDVPLGVIPAEHWGCRMEPAVPLLFQRKFDAAPCGTWQPLELQGCSANLPACLGSLQLEQWNSASEVCLRGLCCLWKLQGWKSGTWQQHKTCSPGRWLLQSTWTMLFFLRFLSLISFQQLFLNPESLLEG